MVATAPLTSNRKKLCPTLVCPRALHRTTLVSPFRADIIIIIITFVLQRVADSNFDSSADRLPGTVNHLVVGERDVKFL